MQNKFFSARRMAFIAAFAALTIVATIVIVIPSPVGEGFINVGDAVIFLCAALLDPISALIVGGVGSALGDLILGFAYYAPFTLVVKGLEGLFAALLIKLLRKTKLPAVFCFAFAMIIAGCWMAVGYCISETILYGWAMGIANVPFNLIQAGVSVVLGAALATLLTSMRSVKNFLP